MKRPANAQIARLLIPDRRAIVARIGPPLNMPFSPVLRQDLLSDVSITRLAPQCGFSDAAHGSRTFKERFGITPWDFRESAHSPRP
jgi:AraC-like DNA-binding protein